MIAADRPVQRRPSARMLHVDAVGEFTHARRWQLASLVRPGDIVVANDAATLPASLGGIHERTNATIEVRLAARARAEHADAQVFEAVLFGAGNFRTRTEHRPLPPTVATGDRLHMGSLVAIVEAVLDHPRFVRLRFMARAADFWRMLAKHGRPIQYAHLLERLALWDVWTPIAASPVAYEAPSASFVLDWSMLAALREKGATFATLTHAAGLSSTGDPVLDRCFPLDEPYSIPASTVLAIELAYERGARVIAIGTSVVRALEHATRGDGTLRAGAGIADQRIGANSRLRIVDAIVSGMHEAGTSHYELLRAFLSDEVLQRMTQVLDAHEYLSHEFGDTVFIERDDRGGPAHREREIGRSGSTSPVPLRKHGADLPV